MNDVQCPMCLNWAKKAADGMIRSHRSNITNLLGTGYEKCKGAGHTLEKLVVKVAALGPEFATRRDFRLRTRRMDEEEQALRRRRR